MYAKMSFKFNDEDTAQKAKNHLESFFNLVLTACQFTNSIKVDKNKVKLEGDFDKKDDDLDESLFVSITDALMNVMPEEVFTGKFKFENTEIPYSKSTLRAAPGRYAIAVVERVDNNSDEEIFIGILGGPEMFLDDSGEPEVYENRVEFSIDYYDAFDALEIDFKDSDKFLKYLISKEEAEAQKKEFVFDETLEEEPTEIKSLTQEEIASKVHELFSDTASK